MSASYPDLNLTNFPENIDTFMQWLNITATDGPLIAQYQSAMEAGNTTLANQILSQIPSGTQKIIKATDLNQLTQALLAVERFYLTDIQPYIENQQENWLSVINQFDYKGVWSNGTSYEVNNLVTYTVSGLTLVYIATSTPPVGTVPTNTVYWRLLTIQGQQGISGQGLSYRQEWNISANYQVNDSVTYNNALWMAIQPSVAQTPGDGSAYWQKVMNLEVTTYPIQDTQPENQTVNSLWLNTSDSPTDYYYLEPLTNPIEANMIPIGYQTYDAQGQVLDGQGPLPIASGGTDAVDSQNALNNLGGSPRVNKIINGNFIINQRSWSQTKTAVNQRIQDMWELSWGSGASGSAEALQGGGVEINSAAVSGNGSGGIITNKFEGAINGTWTLSVYMKVDSLPAGSNIAIQVANDTKQSYLGYAITSETAKIGVYSIYSLTTNISGWENSDAMRVSVYNYGGPATFSTNCVKLEQGSSQTLAHQKSDGSWELLPQIDNNFIQTLIKCKQYQRIIESSVPYLAQLISSEFIDFVLPSSEPMRTTPVIEGEGLIVRKGDGAVQSGFTFSVLRYTGDAFLIRATKSGHGLTYNDFPHLIAANQNILLTANL